MAIDASIENFAKQQEITNRIDQLIKEIKQDTGGRSTHNHMLNHPNFAELVGMGDIIVNYIFYLMFEKGSDWLYIHLLGRICNGGPEPNRDHIGKIRHQTVAWMTWYLGSEYYKKDDIYFGLVKEE